MGEWEFLYDMKSDGYTKDKMLDAMASGYNCYELSPDDYEEEEIEEVIDPSNIIDYALKKYRISINKSNVKLLDIFKRIKEGKRFLEKDVAFLISENYLKQKRLLFIEYHLREAKYYVTEYSLKKDLWNIVNACSSYRKAEKPQEALKITKIKNISKIQIQTLKFAMLITQGGAYRDLGELDKAIKNAKEVFNREPNNFRPCTLLGAVYYDKGEYSLGQEWFDKAEKRGALKANIDAEIKSIYRRMKEKKTFKKHLLEIDSDRYKWLNDN